MTDSRPRTAAANDAWREKGARSKAVELLERVPYLTDRDLVAVAHRLLYELRARGLEVPEV